MDLDRPPHHRTPSTSTTTTTTSTPTAELFVCFTSRLSSSASMKLSKSILSPGRARDPSVSLSTSLSRRLRTNGSIKAGQASPMFPSSAKKRSGSAFENPEPSSPKVTCIGQVRVKTKKKVKHTRSLSKRRSGDLSFRKLEQAQEGVNLSEERDRDRDRLSLQNQRSSSVHYQQQECHVPHRNQRWVHLPLTICEALRAFGAEFSCLFPCRSSCFSTNDRGKEEKGNGSKESDHNGQQQEQRSCGAVFARWLVALQDGEGGKGREIELVVAGGDDEERIAGRPSTTMRSSRSRRHVFEDIDFKDESFQVHRVDGEEVAEEEEKARVSICIPPKNALLLMRCRSDPMKMAALTNRFWETPAATKVEDSDGDGDEAVEVEIQKGESKYEVVVMEKECEEEDEVAKQNLVSSINLEEKEEDLGEETTMEMEVVSSEQEEAELMGEEEVKELELEVEHEQEDSDLVSADSQIDQQNTENVEPISPISEQEVEEEEGSITPLSTSSPINSPERASSETEENIAPLPLEASVQEDGEIGDFENTEETTGHESEEEEEEEEEDVEDDEEEEEEEDVEDDDEEEEEEESESDTEIENRTLKEELEKEEASEDESVKKVSKKDVLPECLLLMMCEPKLSMEVSKETWVCSTDFIRWLPERQQVKVSKTDASDDSKKRLSTDNKKSSATTTINPTCPAPPPADNKNHHHLLQPPRSSCSLPPRSSCSLPAAAVSGVSMASMIEQKLVNAVGYEPFVLTRCKSEPMRTAAKLAAPEPCFWKNRKLEPHRRATFGFGAAGVGF